MGIKRIQYGQHLVAIFEYLISFQNFFNCLI